MKAEEIHKGYGKIEDHKNALGVRRRQIPKDFVEEVANVAPRDQSCISCRWMGWDGARVGQ